MRHVYDIYGICLFHTWKCLLIKNQFIKAYFITTEHNTNIHYLHRNDKYFAPEYDEKFSMKQIIADFSQLFGAFRGVSK